MTILNQNHDILDIATWAVALVMLYFTARNLRLIRKHLDNERVHVFIERLLELDRMMVEDPQLAILMFQHAEDKDSYFYAHGVANEEDRRREEQGATSYYGADYFRLKTYVYMWLNAIDEFVCVCEKDSSLQKQVEFEDWIPFIIHKLKHPLLKDVYNNERVLWGERLSSFVSKHQDKLNSPNTYERRIY